jgi:hypothetical protein
MSGIRFIFAQIVLSFVWCCLFLLYDEYYQLIELYLNRSTLAIHEGGHTVAVWVCSMVSGFDYATIDYKVRGGWTCWMEHNWDKTADSDWCRLVISLAGMAGEYRFSDIIRTSWSNRDLNHAWKQASKIVLAGDPAPWDEHEQVDFPFQQLYPDATPEHLRVIRIAWNKAIEVIDQYGNNFLRLKDLILEKTTVKEADIEPILGHRGVVCACAAASVFVKPEIILEHKAI